jgi:group I intron endonuclease
MSKSGGIYLIRCWVNAAIYVGSAKFFEKRRAEHFGMLKKNKHHNRHMQNAWNAYGSGAFTFEEHVHILGPYDKTIYFAVENQVMDQCRNDGVKLFNGPRAGSGWNNTTLAQIDDVKMRISIGTRRAMENPLVRKKISDAKLGVAVTPEARAKISTKLKGVSKSEETRANMRIAQQNIPEEKLKQKQASMSAIGRKNIGRSPVNAIPITFRGATYTSVGACSRSTGSTPHQIMQELYGKDYRRKKLNRR